MQALGFFSSKSLRTATKRTTTNKTTLTKISNRSPIISTQIQGTKKESGLFSSIYITQKSNYHGSCSLREAEKKTTEESEKSTQETNTKEEETKPTKQKQEEGKETPKPSGNIHEKNLKIKELEDKIKEYREQLSYSLAERDNIRKIADRDVKKAKEFGITGIAKKLFSVVDTVNLCLLNTKPEDQKHPANVAIKAIKGDLSKVFREYDVEEYSVKPGDVFDMNKHDAIFEMPPTDESPAGTIGAMVKSGWSRKGKLLRAAQVAVVPGEYKPPNKETKQNQKDDQKETEQKSEQSQQQQAQKEA